MDAFSRWALSFSAALLLSLTSTPLAGQGTPPSTRPGPTTTFMVAGYGTAGWQATTGNGEGNSFFGSVSPLLLFRFGDRFLYEAELEFEIEEGVTRTSLEYAQLDFFLNDNITVVAGKFLLPFGVFGERLHPTWINRFASNPPLFGHGDGGVSPLLPILSDFGAMIRGSWAFEEGRAVTASIFVTQGPSVEAHDEEEEAEPHGTLLSSAFQLSSEGSEEEEEHGDLAPLPEFQFGGNAVDNNKDKMIGARLAWVMAPNFELDASAMTGAFDDEGSRLTGVNLAAEFRKGATEIRGEGFSLWYDVEEPAEEGEEHSEGTVRAKTGGYYLQAAHRRGPWEPVFRWTQTLGSSADGFEDRDGFYQVGFGLNYWFSPAIALMTGYEINKTADTDLPDRLLVHWSFGF